MQDITTTQDVSAQFGVTERTVREWIKDGKLPPPIRIGRRPFWLKETITAFIDAKAAEATADADIRNYTAEGRPVHRMISTR